MFQSRKLNVRINRLHERALRVVYKDFDLSFKDLLRRDISFNWELESKQSTFIVSVIEIPIMAHALFTYLFVHLIFFLQFQEETKLLWLSSWRNDFLKHFLL